jgi:arylsulfatase A-like enzyme
LTYEPIRQDLLVRFDRLGLRGSGDMRTSYRATTTKNQHRRHLGRRHRSIECQCLLARGYQTPNIDRVANEGIMFTDYYAEQSCTAGRASFITGQSGLRTGMTKVGLPGATLGLQKEDPTIAELLKPFGYATGQFGKNHLGDRNEFLPTVHGFDEFYGYPLARKPK